VVCIYFWFKPVYNIPNQISEIYLNSKPTRYDENPFAFCSVVTANHIVTYRPIARKRIGKDIPMGADARNNRTSNARQLISKHAIENSVFRGARLEFI
jgi:hypothetical protein